MQPQYLSDNVSIQERILKDKGIIIKRLRTNVLAPNVSIRLDETAIDKLLSWLERRREERE